MDVVNIYLLGVMTGVFIVIACAAGAFCWGAGDFYTGDGGPRDDG
ncbi:hypothetical protein SAMN04487958_107179 [Vreelandella subterranea]|uniref:Uncharacterized protein n=1 Tax=Vreelandella subterranea TaxID=416874 RepID=A0A1H9URR7_9GAMM|nr:hypothetical protein [Halomonas subterranea]SES12102.1 hypothetical protein SAMN04487958_107179 [Halomonas subterranea]